MDWEYWKKGGYNRVFRKGNRILKIPKEAHTITDNPIRSVRLWNSINSDIVPPAELYYKDSVLKGWTCPFIEGVQSTDEEISNKLIDIYLRTGRVVIDAASKENFLTQKDGKVVLVDVGLALEIENLNFSNPNVKRKSIISKSVWDSNYTSMDGLFDSIQRFQPQTIMTIKALLYLSLINYLKQDFSLLLNRPDFKTQFRLFATAYDEQRKVFPRCPLHTAQKDQLAVTTPINFFRKGYNKSDLPIENYTTSPENKYFKCI